MSSNSTPHTRKPMMAGNWKMHHTHLEAIQVVQKLSYRLEQSDYVACDVVVCPAFTALRSVQTTIDSDHIPIALGAQDCYWETQGAFTGEVSAPMLAKLNVSYVIVGHSERRQIFGETDEMVAKKLHATLASGMLPILCVGETLEEREAGGTDAKVQGQVEAALREVGSDAIGDLVIAYEPIWAIGTGHNATPQDASSTIGTIRATVAALAGEPASQSTRILYGGSVKPGNIASLMAESEVDGALIGGASLDPDEFARVVRFAHAS
jgi:triosephosphate isomerase